MTKCRHKIPAIPKTGLLIALSNPKGDAKRIIVHRLCDDEHLYVDGVASFLVALNSLPVRDREGRPI